MQIRKINAEDMMRLTAFTAYDDLDDRQALFTKRTFLFLSLDLLMTVLCFGAVLFFNDLLFALLGLFSGVRAVIGVVRYAGIVFGAGLRTDFLFLPDRLLIRECGASQAIPYDKVTMAKRLRLGLVLRFQDGSGRLIPPISLRYCDDEEALLSFLKEKLGDRMKNMLCDAEYVNREEERLASLREQRERSLGRQLAEVIYEVDGVDRRDYCRLVFSTGKTGKVCHALVSVFAAVATVSAGLSVVLHSLLFSVVCYAAICVIGAVLLLTKIGLGGPARKRFFNSADGKPVYIYLHENGVWAEGDRRTSFCRFEELAGVCYDSSIGMSFDFGKEGVAFVPYDTTPEEILMLVHDKVNGERQNGKH